MQPLSAIAKGRCEARNTSQPEASPRTPKTPLAHCLGAHVSSLWGGGAGPGASCARYPIYHVATPCVFAAYPFVVVSSNLLAHVLCISLS